MTALLLVVVVVSAYVALGALAWFAGERIMFQPPPASYGADELDLVRFETEDGLRLAALYLRNPDAELTLLFSHGNAEDLGWARPSLEALRALGFSVLAYDYRGYGLSEGRPTAGGAVLDIEAAYRYLTREAGVAPDRIVLHGRSLGGGPSLDLATREPVAGVILESAFTTAFRVVTVVPLFPFDRFRNIDRIGQVDAPVLVMHGRDDEVVAFSHGLRLHEAAGEPKRRLWIDDAHHNDLRWTAGERYDRALLDFAALVLERQRPR